MPPRPSTEIALLEYTLDALNENTKIVAANAAAVEQAEQARLQGLADRDEALAVVADAKEAVREATALIRHIRGQVHEQPPMPHIAPSHPIHLATADLLKSREGRVALVLLAAALALVALALAITAGLDPRILSELAP